jgi:hypothetical protein
MAGPVDLTQHTRLAARWLAPARLAWLALVGLLLGLYAYDIGPSRLLPDLTVGAMAWNVGMPVGFAVIGGLIFWRKSDDWMGLLTSFALIGMGVYLLTGVGEDLALRPGWRFANDLLQGLTGGSFVLLVFLFPDGRFVPPRGRPAALALTAVCVLAFVLGGFANWPTQIVIAGFWVAVTAAVMLQIYRYFRVSGPLQRQQTKWVVAGLVSPAAVTLQYFFLIAPYQAQLAAAGIQGPLLILEMLLALLLPLAIAISILRYRLWDIDILVNRALVYGTLTLLLAFGYLGAVVILQAIFQAVAGQARSELVTVLSTLLIAALAAPLRRRLQTAIDRRFYRRRYDAARTLEGFGATLRDNVDLDQLSSRLVAVVDDTMQPVDVSLWLKS